MNKLLYMCNPKFLSMHFFQSVTDFGKGVLSMLMGIRLQLLPLLTLCLESTVYGYLLFLVLHLLPTLHDRN